MEVIDETATIADIFAEVIETGLTFKNAMRLIAASTAGNTTGDATTRVFKAAVEGTKSRISSTPSGGNRVITTDLT
jgi:hypothetical protein